MRLQVNQLEENYHQEMVTSCCWTSSNEVVTCSDDNSIVKWMMDGEVSGKITTMDAYVTAVDWIPSIGKQGADLFVVSCTDGTFRLISKSGREEKKVQVSDHGAVITLKWNYDGTALATAGEDGAVKVWSRSGNLRSTLAQIGKSVYTLVWGPDNDQILFSSGKDLIIKTIQVGRKQLCWKAHDGVVMRVDWNPINNRIVSGGEDRIYRVWDSFGRQLYQSVPCAYVITSVSWSPNGETFAVGAFDMLLLCDKTGWSYCHEQLHSGSLMDIAWASDGTQLAAAGGNGATIFAQLVDRKLEWNNLEVILVDPKKIRVHDIVNETMEELEFARDRVVEMSLGFGYLIVATANQCYIYNVQNWNTPHIFDLRASVNLILQSDRHFIATDNFHGIQVYSYEGRSVSNIRFNGLRVEFLNSKTISMSTDTVAVLDHTDGGKTVRSFDIMSGRPLPTVITHNLNVSEFALNQYGPSTERKLLFVDSNRDLYITPIPQKRIYKLATQVESAAWNSESDQLVAIQDGKLVTWSYPNIVYVDRSLLPLTTVTKEGTDYMKLPQITNFTESRVTIRRTDGAVLVSCVPPYPNALYECASNGKWEEAVRLCRFVKNKELWACLAGMALSSRHLDTAEIALAAVEEVDKLHFILHIKNIPSEEGRNAELALYQRNIEEAENILLQAQPPLIYRAIKMNIRLFRWARALDLAIKHKTHVDTVLAYREQYLQSYKIDESDSRFLQYSKEVTIDWEAISAKKQQEYEKEKEMAGRSRRK